MELIVTVGERQEEVRIRAISGGYEIGLGEATYWVDSTSVGPRLRSFLVRQNGNADPRHHQCEVFVQNLQAGRYWVRTDGPYPGSTVDVADPLTHLAKESRGGSGRSGRCQVTAYMPGRVVAVLAQEGETVEEHQGVIVLEAMKMENEIPAESPGTITKILVEPGQAVDAGDPLFEIE